jgi:hypothetical protein
MFDLSQVAQLVSLVDFHRFQGLRSILHMVYEDR